MPMQSDGKSTLLEAFLGFRFNVRYNGHSPSSQTPLSALSSIRNSERSALPHVYF